MPDIPNDEFVISPDVTFTPCHELGEETMRHFEATATDVFLKRRRGRRLSKVVGAGAAQLLDYFRQPQRIEDGILAYCRANSLDYNEMFGPCYGVLESLIKDRFLVPKDAPEAAELVASISTDSFEGFGILESIRVLDDSEVYMAEDPSGKHCAIKIARSPLSGSIAASLKAEREVLALLGGRHAPALLAHGDYEGRPYVVTEWIDGRPVAFTARRLRKDGRVRDLVALALRVVETYAAIHDSGVIQGDVHPSNVIADADGNVRVLDFGLARILDATEENHRRGGVMAYFEPEYARAHLEGVRRPPATALGEQYAVGALVYVLMTGRTYTQFSSDRQRLYRQIVDDPPTPFSQEEANRYGNIESAIGKALMKDPDRRFRRMKEFALAIRESAGREAGGSPFNSPG